MLHLRARTMSLLSLPAVAIEITPSLILIVMMKTASVLQNLFRQQLPGTLGIAQDSPLQTIGVLVLTGTAMGLVIRFSQDHTRPDPACESLIDAPAPPSALPGLIIALILDLAGDVNLGPEYPTMTVSAALAIATGIRLLPRVSRMEWTTLVSAGTIGVLFGVPAVVALIFSQTLSDSSEILLWDRLFALLMAAAAGTLTIGLSFHPHLSLPIAYYGQTGITDILNGAIVAAIAIAAGVVVVRYLPRPRTMMNQMRNPVLVLDTDGSVLGILEVIGGSISLLEGLDEMQQAVASQAFSTSDYFLLVVIKLVALVVAAVSDFRGGRVFSAVLAGVVLGLVLHEHVPVVPVAIAVSCAILGTVLVVTRDGWLSPFMAVVVVSNTTLLPLFYVVMLPAWLLSVGGSMMMVNHPKRQSPHDSVQQKMPSPMIQKLWR